jgi:hypothetical protein
MDFKAAKETVLNIGDKSGYTLEMVGRSDEGLTYLSWLSQQKDSLSVQPGLEEALNVFLSEPSVAEATQRAQATEPSAPESTDNMPTSTTGDALANPFQGSGTGTLPEAATILEGVQSLHNQKDPRATGQVSNRGTET